MDNYTLLVTLCIILAIDMFFTFMISGNAEKHVSKAWRSSFLFLFLGFLMLLMQTRLSPLFSVIAANYFILLGFYYQVLATLSFEYQRDWQKRGLLTILSLLFLGSYLYFTYINFSTTSRIIIISALLFIFYTAGIILLGRFSNKKRREPLKTRELYLLFVLSALFYLFRLIFTILGTGRVDSLFDQNLITTASLLSVILASQVFLSGLFHAVLRKKTDLVTTEKEKLGYLFNFLNDTAKYLDLEELYGTIEKTLRESLGVDTAAIYLANDNRESLSMAYFMNALDLPLDEVKTLKKGEGVTGEAFEKERVIELEMDDYPNKTIARLYRDRGVKKIVSIPLKSVEGVLGTITVVFTGSMAAERMDREFLYYLGEQIGLVLHNALLYRRLKEMAHIDPLTGLYNRRKMIEICTEEMKRVKRNGRSFTLALVDLDKFKNINDSYGHECGDEVLKSSAELFRKECRDYDFICRWGGEEFLLLFIDSNLPAAERTAERIRLSHEKMPLPCISRERVTISMGLTEYQQELTLEQMIALADQALYSAKEQGRNRIMVKK